jgi:hypothetical protein
MKRKFRFAKLASAIALAAGAGGASVPGFAVNLSDDGLGDTALVPFYTVRNGISTYLSVVNTSPQYVAAFKIRFRESADSHDARDFNVFLSPNDVWTAVVTMGTDGKTPIIQTADKSCTAPILTEQGTNSDMTGISFTTDGFTGSLNDSGPTTIERTQDGHFEIIEMGVADPAASDIAAWAVNGSGQNCKAIENTYLGTQKVSPSGVCSTKDGNYSTTGPGAFSDEFCEPLNVLKVAANIQAITAGASTGLPVTQLANFFNPGTGFNVPAPVPGVPVGQEDQALPGAPDLMFEPASDRPNLNQALPTEALQTTNLGNIDDIFNDGVDAVSSLLTATNVINEYAIGGAADAATTWVVNFPTKNFYVDPTNPEVTPPPVDPFQEVFSHGASCVDIIFDYYNRAEGQVTGGNVLPPSPPPPGPPGNFICEEMQTLYFGSVDPLDATYGKQVDLAQGFENGWMRLNFPNATSIVGTDYTYHGLPVISFGLKILQNAAVRQGVLQNYAILENASYDRDISPNSAGVPTTVAQ